MPFKVHNMQVVSDNKLKGVTLPASVKSLVVDSNTQRRRLVEELLSNMGFSTLESCGELCELNRESENIGATASALLLVIYLDTVTDTAMKALKQFLSSRPMPVLLLIDNIEADAQEKALQAGVTAFLSLGVQGNRVKQAIDSAFASFALVSQLQQQISHLENRLQERIIVDKAKGLVMKNRGLDEAQAYSFLRKYAMRNGRKLIDVARMTLETSELLDI